VTDAELDADEQGWKRNPMVGVTAAVVIFIALVIGCCRLCCRGGSEAWRGTGTVTMICPHCNEAYTLRPKDLGLDKDASPDQMQEKAKGAPCPKCGKTDSVLACFCPKCGKPFAVPKTLEELDGFRCPHCGEKPWQR